MVDHMAENQQKIVYSGGQSKQIAFDGFLVVATILVSLQVVKFGCFGMC